MGDRAMAGRIGVVTGASAGIGEAVARELAARGCRVVLTARRAERLAALAGELNGASAGGEGGGRRSSGGPVAVAHPGDAADPAVVEGMLDAAKEHFGGEADCVIVNAGRGLRGGVLDSDDAEWEEVVRINLLGAARLMRAAAHRMETLEPTPLKEGWERRRPRDIVVIGSTVGRHVSPFSSFYGAAKAGVHMLAESLRRTAGPKGVRVSLIEPGVVKTEFQEVAHYDPAGFGTFMDSISPVLTAEDVARVVGFVVSQPAGMHVNDVMVRPTRQEYP